jgi:hypothetical protein
MLVFGLFSTRIELGMPISQKQPNALAGATPESNRAALEGLATDARYKQEVLAKRFSILNVFED